MKRQAVVYLQATLGMRDQLVTGRRFRVLSFVDDVTRKCIRAVVDRSIPGRRVVRELADLIAKAAGRR